MSENIDARLARLEAGLLEIRSGQGEIKATLGHILLLLQRMDDRLNRPDERQNGLEANLAEFRGEVRGLLAGMGERIGDINARLPVPIAYSPPSPRTAAE